MRDHVTYYPATFREIDGPHGPECVLDTPSHVEIKCACGDTCEAWGGRDTWCDTCGREYNGSGQLLAPRSQWGEETGEHPADIARAFGSNPNPTRGGNNV